MTDDWYQVLQVHPSAEPEVIAAAYKRLARKYHPDLNASSDATEMMQRLNDAYSVLRDPHKRATYDRVRRQRVRIVLDDEVVSARGPRSRQPQATQARAAQQWNGSRGRARKERHRQEPQRGNESKQPGRHQSRTDRSRPEPQPADHSSSWNWWPLACLVGMRVGMTVGEQLDPWLVARFGWESGYGEPLGAIVVPLAILAICVALRASA